MLDQCLVSVVRSGKTGTAPSGPGHAANSAYKANARPLALIG
jgi:hypothetical protein